MRVRKCARLKRWTGKGEKREKGKLGEVKGQWITVTDDGNSENPQRIVSVVPKFEWIHERVSKTEPDTRRCGFSRGFARTKGPTATYIYCLSLSLFLYIYIYRTLSPMYVYISSLVSPDSLVEQPSRSNRAPPSIYQQHPCCAQQLGNRTRFILRVNALSWLLFRIWVWTIEFRAAHVTV